MLHVAGQTKQTDVVSAGRLHIPKVRAYAAGKEKDHLRQSHVSRKLLWTKFRDTNAAQHMLCKLSVSSRFTYLNGGRGIRPLLKAL